VVRTCNAEPSSASLMPLNTTPDTRTQRWRCSRVAASARGRVAARDARHGDAAPWLQLWRHGHEMLWELATRHMSGVLAPCVPQTIASPRKRLRCSRVAASTRGRVAARHGPARRRSAVATAPAVAERLTRNLAGRRDASRCDGVAGAFAGVRVEDAFAQA
jgi:hypothetical protein